VVIYPKDETYDAFWITNRALNQRFYFSSYLSMGNIDSYVNDRNRDH